MRSLSSKLRQSALTSLGLVGFMTVTTVGVSRYFADQRRLESIEQEFNQTLDEKGRLLATSYSVALRNLVADNAFGDVDSLLTQAVKSDRDLVFGLFLNSARQPWSFVSPLDAKSAEDRQRWKEMGLPETVLTGAKGERMTVFSRHVRVVTAPVVFDGDQVGTVIFGVSEERMDRALAEAKSSELRATAVSLGILLGVISLVTVVAVILAQRNAKKVTEPLAELTHAASRLAEGDRTARVRISSGDELQRLGETFNDMADDLATSYQSLEALNQGLERRVDERTAELSARNRDMRVVLDNVTQGLLTVRRDGLLAPERSAAVERLLGQIPEAQTLHGALAAKAPAFAEAFGLGLDSLRDEMMPLSVSLELLPKSAELDGRHLRFDYLHLAPLDRQADPDAFGALLVVVSDETAAIERQKAEAAQKQTLEIFRRLSTDAGGFMLFFKEADELVRQLTAPDSSLSAVVVNRLVHTLKGNASLAGLDGLAKRCHAIETEREEATSALTAEHQAALTLAWSSVTATVEQLRGLADDSVHLSREQLRGLASKLRLASALAVADELESLTMDRAEDALRGLGEKARVLAERLGKGELKVEVDAAGVLLEHGTYARLWSELIHVVRNAVDHGLEATAEREQLGKHAPTLKLSAVKAAGAMRITIADDGRGVNWSKLAEKARRLSLPAETRADLVEALFSDGVSTRDEVSETSGRGVGLAALRSLVRELGGTVSVDSAPGRGATFIFDLPTPTPVSLQRGA